MDVRALTASPTGVAPTPFPGTPPTDGFVWVDLLVEEGDLDALRDVATTLQLDPLATVDTIVDRDLPKVDEFDDHVLLVIHGLGQESLSTYELDIFIADDRLTTIRTTSSPTIDKLWSEVQRRPDLSRGGPDEFAARIADVATRRFLAVMDTLDERIEQLVLRALDADASVVGEVTAIRMDLTALRRVLNPQREALDQMRTETTETIGPSAQRRFSDVFDTAQRATANLDAARTSLAETLDAYRGAEASKATDVSKVLTVYAAIMLPLSLIAGFFGMNFENLPWTAEEWGWMAVTIGMVVLGVVSLGVFIALGWIRRPSGRSAGRTLGRGLAEAARTPAHIATAALEISVQPLRRGRGKPEPR